MPRVYPLPLVLTAMAGCGSGPASPSAQTTAASESKVIAMRVTAAAPDAGVADAGLSPPLDVPKFSCAEGSAVQIAAAPEATYFCAKPDGTRDGPFESLFPDGTVAIDGAFKAGKLDGPWRRRYPGGAIAEAGAYAAGEKDGAWQQLGPTGAPLGEYTLKAGTGLERTWYDDGPLYRERQLKAGVPWGPLKVYDHDGQLAITAKQYGHGYDGARAVGAKNTLRIEETFTAGTRHDARQIWQFWQLVMDENYDLKGKLDGAYTIWRDSVKKIPRMQGTYDHGKRTGTWSWFDRNDNKEREGDYTDGKRTGAWFEWTENKLTFSGNYTDGKPDGEFVYYDAKGAELGKFELKDGSGTMITFHPNKKPATKQVLYKGDMDGLYQELTPRGKVVVEGRYAGDRKHGTWREWTDLGVLTLEEHWKHGKLDGDVKKLDGGKLVEQTTYKLGKADGAYTEFRNGKPWLTGQYAGDLRAGTWTTYDENGAVTLTATYKDNVLDGPWKQIETGVVTEGTMLAGRRSGTWTRTERGGPSQQMIYKIM